MECEQIKLCLTALKAIAFEYNVITSELTVFGDQQLLDNYGPDDQLWDGYRLRQTSLIWWKEKIHPDDFPRLQSAFHQELAAQSSRIKMGFRLRKSNEGWSGVTATGTVRYTREKKPWVISGCLVVDDACQSVVAPPAVRTSETLPEFTAIATASTDAIMLCTSDCIITSWNDGAEKIFGWSAEDAIGRSVKLLIPPDKLHEHEEIRTKVAQGDICIIQTQRLSSDGSVLTVWASISGIRVEGQLTGYAGIYRDQRETIARSDHIAFMLRELSHRSKNLMAVVLGIARQTGKRAPDYEHFKDRFTTRLLGLAKSHDLLVLHDWNGVDLQSLFREQLAIVDPVNRMNITLSGPSIFLKAEATQALGLAMQELISNARKYGALRYTDGKIDITWMTITSASEPCLSLSWRETSGSHYLDKSELEDQTRQEQSTGFGTVILTDIAPKSVSGEATIVYGEDGLHWQLKAPMRTLTPPLQDKRA